MNPSNTKLPQLKSSFMSLTNGRCDRKTSLQTGPSFQKTSMQKPLQMADKQEKVASTCTCRRRSQLCCITLYSRPLQVTVVLLYGNKAVALAHKLSKIIEKKISHWRTITLIENRSNQGALLMIAHMLRFTRKPRAYQVSVCEILPFHCNRKPSCLHSGNFLPLLTEEECCVLNRAGNKSPTHSLDEYTPVKNGKPVFIPWNQWLWHSLCPHIKQIQWKSQSDTKAWHGKKWNSSVKKLKQVNFYVKFISCSRGTFMSWNCRFKDWI